VREGERKGKEGRRERGGKGTRVEGMEEASGTQPVRHP